MAPCPSWLLLAALTLRALTSLPVQVITRAQVSQSQGVSTPRISAHICDARRNPIFDLIVVGGPLRATAFLHHRMLQQQ